MCLGSSLLGLYGRMSFIFNIGRFRREKYLGCWSAIIKSFDYACAQMIFVLICFWSIDSELGPANRRIEDRYHYEIIKEIIKPYLMFLQ